MRILILAPAVLLLSGCGGGGGGTLATLGGGTEYPLTGIWTITATETGGTTTPCTTESFSGCGSARWEFRDGSKFYTGGTYYGTYERVGTKLVIRQSSGGRVTETNFRWSAPSEFRESEGGTMWTVWTKL